MLSKKHQDKHLRKENLVLCPTCHKSAAHPLRQIVLLLREGIRQIATTTHHGWDVTSHASLDSFESLTNAVVQHLWTTKHLPCTALLHHISAFMTALDSILLGRFVPDQCLEKLAADMVRAAGCKPCTRIDDLENWTPQGIQTWNITAYSKQCPAGIAWWKPPNFHTRKRLFPSEMKQLPVWGGHFPTDLHIQCDWCRDSVHYNDLGFHRQIACKQIPTRTMHTYHHESVTCGSCALVMPTCSESAHGDECPGVPSWWSATYSEWCTNMTTLHSRRDSPENNFWMLQGMPH